MRATALAAALCTLLLTSISRGQSAPCRQAARAAFALGNEHRRAERWNEVEQSWTSTYVWTRGSVPTRHLVEVLSYRERHLEAAALACTFIAQSSGPSSNARVIQARDIVRRVCREARDRWPALTFELVVPEVPACDDVPRWRFEVEVNGQPAPTDRLQGIPLEGVARVVLRFQPKPRLSKQPAPPPSRNSQAPNPTLKLDVPPATSPVGDAGNANPWCTGARLRPCLFGTLGVGIAAAAVVPTYALLEQRREARAACPNHRCTDAEALERGQRHREQAREHGRHANALLVSGAVIALGSAGWYLTSSSAPDSSSVSAFCAPGECQLSVHGAF